MITAQDLAEAFARNLNVIQRQTKGLTHQDSLLQLPFRGNCLNWVLGHIAGNRNRVLRILGREPALSEAEAARYGYGSEPVCGEGEGVLRLERLIAALEDSQARIEAGLQRITSEELARELKNPWGTATAAQTLFFLYYHETYHTGQTELLRQLAGTDDKVI